MDFQWVPKPKVIAIVIILRDSEQVSFSKVSLVAAAKRLSFMRSKVLSSYGQVSEGIGGTLFRLGKLPNSNLRRLQQQRIGERQ